MALPKAKVIYKKKDGVIEVSADKKCVIWTPAPATGPPLVSLALAKITNLQQTPDSAPKVMLRIYEKPSGDGEPVPFSFQFSSPTDARAEANAIRDVISKLLAEIRTQDPNLPKPIGAAGAGADAGAVPSSIAFAKSTQTKPSTNMFDDEQLKIDVALQESLMKKVPSLHEVYMDARQSKAAAMTESAFNAQFWSTRTKLLRAHAIELNQRKGAYNVLSAVKPRTIDGELKLSISHQQVQELFQQHPLVRTIYNENVPKLSENEFWSRFFLSRLAKQLRGERVTDNDAHDSVFDKYNASDDLNSFYTKINAAESVPHMIDIAGNEENQGGVKSGNRKDIEMRPRQNVPIIKSLNSLSAKIMANVAPSDGDAMGNEGEEEDERYKNNLALRDLRGDTTADRVILNVKEQSKFFANQDVEASEEDSKAYTSQVPSEVLLDLEADLEALDEEGHGGMDLHKCIGIDDDGGSDDDDVAPREDHVGSRASRILAKQQILAGMRRKRAETSSLDNAEDVVESPMGIPLDLAQRCYLTNATTTEFLKQFWGAFLSGDADRAQELVYHVESLKKSQHRIDTLADEADVVRGQLIEQKKNEIREYYKSTGRKIRWKPDSIRGGQKEVLTLMAGSIEALQHALNLYQRALEEEGAEPAVES